MLCKLKKGQTVTNLGFALVLTYIELRRMYIYDLFWPYNVCFPNYTRIS